MINLSCRLLHNNLKRDLLLWTRFVMSPLHAMNLVANSSNAAYCCQTSNISHTEFQNLNVSHLVLQLSLPNPLKEVLIWEWRCSWSSADRRCSNYIWGINKFIAYWSATYIRCLKVVWEYMYFILDCVTTVLKCNFSSGKRRRSSSMPNMKSGGLPFLPVQTMTIVRQTWNKPWLPKTSWPWYKCMPRGWTSWNHLLIWWVPQ